MDFQRQIEELAFQAGNGRIPVQLYGDFKKGQISSVIGEVEPQIKGLWSFGNLRAVLPTALCQALSEGMDGFGGIIKGFDRADALFAGVESRTSSPVRIWRDEGLQSSVQTAGALSLWRRSRLCRRNHFCCDGRHPGCRGCGEKIPAFIIIEKRKDNPLCA